ncbi:MAG: glycosyltransferase family 2 protein [Bacteroidia bacterium]|nr:glycosyltransferase family 2 protein [Bacteroidia bacterium]
MKRIAAIVPAYNEEEAIAFVVNDINALAESQQLLIDVIVVNDCSKDSTANVISKLKCIALNLPINLGIGGAVQTGFRYALENGYDFAIQIDGDGQHPASEIPKIVNAAINNDFDVVIGSRFISNEGFQSSAFRRMGINYFKWLNRLLVGTVVNDSTSGFRLINRKVLEIVAEYYPDEYPEPEAIIMYSLHNFKIGEVSVTMKERQGGVSSIGTFASVYYMFKVTLAIIFTFTRMKFRKRVKS